MNRFSFITVVLLGSFIYISSYSTEIKGWKTLRNRHGWNIQYPTEWMLDEDYNGQDGGEYPLSPPRMEGWNSEQEYNPEICGPVRPKDLRNQNGCIRITPGTVMGNYGKPLKNSGPLKTTVEYDLSPSESKALKNEGKIVKVSGFPAFDEVVTKGTGSNKVTIRRIAIGHPDGNFLIQYFELKNNRENFLPQSEWKYEKVFEKMLSTFKFTDQKPKK